MPARAQLKIIRLSRSTRLFKKKSQATATGVTIRLFMIIVRVHAS